MIIEYLLYAIIAFAGGTYLGKTSVKPTVQKQQSPDRWTPEDHREMINSCRIACDAVKFKAYKSLTGECVCQNGDK